ncbi:TIGR03086 family metal-binding protein [Actinomadura parmotrematis]|uniref:TIGR03086 family protein n=1 Tax=Actinomadura parmotrematis TaxID=2864039 RepID=A0ABS7G3G1_9ACTN|nr:TIGR03086 family metal-binding protein [Actinomadura parmotrematis]MBW8487232.1 TIGR03086 family protein [Actinomadura parmotrematis]
MDLPDLQRLNATALALIGHDVALVPDTALAEPTPCEGWAVADLLHHMNERHDAVARTVLGPLDAASEDPRADFARIAARWSAALQRTGPTLDLPNRGPVPTDWVLGVHTVDMLVHRWDLARALDLPLPVPAALAAAALPLARASTAPGSPLNQPGGAYLPPVDAAPATSTMDTIAALLGRDPRWTPPGTSGTAR